MHHDLRKLGGGFFADRDRRVAVWWHNREREPHYGKRTVNFDRDHLINDKPQTECHRTVGMVFAYRSRGPLPLALNCDNTGCFSDTVSRAPSEICEEFYDTL